jgi:2-oxoglutarate dehydrogenase E2 component (dihydrolipoamide succinyltransferase)
MGEKSEAATNGASTAPVQVAAAPAQQQSSGRSSTGSLLAEMPIPAQRPPSPLARRIAAEHNVDISQVQGTSPHGRVTREDVINYLAQPSSSQEAPTQPLSLLAASVATPPSPVPAKAQPLVGTTGKREERIRMSRRRQTIAQRLVEAQHTAAILTTFNEIDMSAVMEVRSRRKESFKERHNISLGFMSFFTKAVIGALKAFPMLNAEIQGNEVVIKHYYDIGIAVGVDEGLVVPVVREADRKSFAEIEREIADLAKRARANQLSLTNLQGGTFTITNGGVYGSMLSTPILNGPQVGILGLHKIEQRPIALNGQVVIRPMMYVALSYDHRLIDGGDAVRFLVRIKELIEDPETLLLEG